MFLRIGDLARILGIFELGLVIRDLRLVSSSSNRTSDAINVIKRELSDYPRAPET